MAFTILDKDGSKINLHDDAAKSALANGADQEIRFVDAEGRYIGKGPASLVKRYAAEKGVYPETQEQRELNDRIESASNEVGTFDAFKNEAANQFLLGVPNTIKDYTESDFDKRVREEGNRKNRLAQVLGGVAGFGANVGLTGGLGKAAQGLGLLGRAGAEVAEQGAVRGVLGAGARVAAESAAYAAPSAAVQAFYGDPEHAAENLALATGAGFVLGGISRGAGMGVKRAGEALGDYLPRAENEQLVKSLFISQSKKDMKSILNAATKEEGALEGAGIDKIGDQMKKSDLRRGIGEDYLEYATRIEQKTGEVGKSIGDRMEVAGELKSLDSRDIISHLDDKINALKDNPLAKEEEKVLKSLKRDFEAKWLEKESELEPNELGLSGKPANDSAHFKKQYLNLEETWKLQRDLDGLIFREGQTPGRIFSKAPTVREQALMDLRNITKSSIDKALETQDSVAFNEIKALRKDYQNLKIMDRIAKNQAQSASNRNFSMSDNQWGTAGNVAGALIGGVSGGGFGAALGSQLIGGAQMIGHKLLRENGNMILAKGLGWLNENVARAAEQEYDSIPKLLSTFGKSSKLVKPMLSSKLGTFANITGDDKIKDDENGFKKVSQAVIQSQMEPNVQTKEIAAAIAKQSPQVASAYQSQANRVNKYLYSELPKNPLLEIPYAKPENWKPTRAQIKSYQSKASVAMDPFSVLTRLQDGTLNKDHIAALKALYPSIAGRVVNEIRAYGMANPNMPYQKKLLLSQLLGEPLDPSLQYVQSNQDAYAQQSEQEKIAKAALTDTPGSEFTEQQKTESGAPA